MFKFLNVYDQLAILVFDYIIRQQTVHFAFIYYCVDTIIPNDSLITLYMHAHAPELGYNLSVHGLLDKRL